jgi:deoxyribonucleoside regulator
MARSYYEQDMTQAQIAKVYGISRSQVSRYLRAARNEGIVQIRIMPPPGCDSEAEAALRVAYPQLRKVVVARAYDRERVAMRRAVAWAAARVFDELVRPGQVVCVGAGRTMAMASALMEQRREVGGVVVPATGDAGHATLESDYSAITAVVAHKLGAMPYRINAPAVLGSGSHASELERSSPQVREALRTARSADVYLLGLGSLAGDEFFVQTGLISAAELAAIRSSGGVGDICGNFYDRVGSDLSGPFSDRVVGISLDDLRRATLAVACAGGEEKVAAIIGALDGRLINGLVTDEHTARGVLAGSGSGAHDAAAE